MVAIPPALFILRAEQNAPFPVGEIVIDLCG
jgi:hypothetical protein